MCWCGQHCCEQLLQLHWLWKIVVMQQTAGYQKVLKFLQQKFDMWLCSISSESGSVSSDRWEAVEAESDSSPVTLPVLVYAGLSEIFLCLLTSTELVWVCPNRMGLCFSSLLFFFLLLFRVRTLGSRCTRSWWRWQMNSTLWVIHCIFCGSLKTSHLAYLMSSFFALSSSVLLFLLDVPFFFFYIFTFLSL